MPVVLPWMDAGQLQASLLDLAQREVHKPLALWPLLMGDYRKGLKEPLGQGVSWALVDEALRQGLGVEEVRLMAPAPEVHAEPQDEPQDLPVMSQEEIRATLERLGVGDFDALLASVTKHVTRGRQ